MLIGVLIPLALFFTQGCGKVKFSSSFRPTVNTNTTPPPGYLPPEVEECPEGCYKETYRQKEETTKKLDIVFVTDTSGSLDAERQEVADGIKNFIGQLPPGTDFNVSVVLGHGSTSAYAGKLYQTSSGEPLVLKSTGAGALTIAQIQTHLKNKLTNIKTDNDSDGGEEGLYSTSQAIKGANLANAQSLGMFRADAGLAVVYIADENDICARYPVGVTRVVDPDNKEIPAFVRDCEDITHTGVYGQLKNLKGTLPLAIGAVIYTGKGAIPAGGENEIGYGYKEIVSLNNGVLVDIASHNITADLAKIGQLTGGTLMLTTEFQLTHSNVNPASIRVYVDGVLVPHTYTPETNSVHIAANQCGAGGSVIVIKYCENGVDVTDNF